MATEYRREYRSQIEFDSMAMMWGFLKHLDPRRNLPAKPEGEAMVPQGENKPDVPDYLEMHRARVAELSRSIFLNFDSKIGQTVGFNGSILEEVFQRRPEHHNDGIDVAGLHPSVRQFVQGSRFSLRVDKPGTGQFAVLYDIECYNGGFNPTIEVATNDGSLQLNVLTGPSHKEFHSMRLARIYHDEAGNFSHAREVRTFVLNSRIGDPDHPLQIGDRLRSQLNTELHYGGIDYAGNVELNDDQYVFLMPRGTTGKYRAADSTAVWDRVSGLEPKTRVDGNTFSIDAGRDERFVFPIRTNIYDQLREMAKVQTSLPLLG